MSETATVKYGKAKSFYETYERKGNGEISTHYCPGCGHGTLQKLIAEAIDDLGIQDRTIFLSPVGCAVFSYYYFDTANIQCSHGRAPAVATGVRRTAKDAIIISYQGDGDLAGIGTTEIIHAANRGENITVFFVNNAIYGMTGGQMAPTTLLGQKTITTPFGRESDRDGRPIGMAEVIASLEAPVYIERCSLATPKGVLLTRKAVRKGLQKQIDGCGFSFIEILSPCPTNWGMDPVQSRTWMVDHLEKQFPIGTLREKRDDSAGNEASVQLPVLDDTQLVQLLCGESEIPHCCFSTLNETQLVKIAGFGGQGVLSAGELLASCGVAEGLHVSWLPSYGPEMRGGNANVSVILSKEDVGSPLVDHPTVLIAMNGPSLDYFEDTAEIGSLILVNSSLIKRQVKRSDVRVIYLPATDIAQETGLAAGANVVMISAYLIASGALSLDTLRSCIPLVLRKKEFLDKNLLLIEQTAAYMKTIDQIG